MGLEDLRTVRLLLLRLADDTESVLKQLPAGTMEREALVVAYTHLQKSLCIIEIQIKAAVTC